MFAGQRQRHCGRSGDRQIYRQSCCHSYGGWIIAALGEVERVPSVMSLDLSHALPERLFRHHVRSPKPHKSTVSFRQAYLQKAHDQCAAINCRQSVAQAGEEKPFSVRALTFSCALSDVLSIRSLSQSRTPPINQSVSLRRIVWPAECNTPERMRWDVVAMVVMLNSA